MSRSQLKFNRIMFKHNEIRRDLEAIYQANRAHRDDQHAQDVGPVSFIGGHGLTGNEVPRMKELQEQGKLFEAAAVFTYDGMNVLLNMIASRMGNFMTEEVLEKVMERVVERTLEKRLTEVIAGANYGFSSFMNDMVGAMFTAPKGGTVVKMPDKPAPNVVPEQAEAEPEPPQDKVETLDPPTVDEPETTEEPVPTTSQVEDTISPIPEVKFIQWSETEDELLATTVLEFISQGKTATKAYGEVAEVLGRTKTACLQRWNTVLRKRYNAEVEHAKNQRRLALTSRT